MSEFAWSEKDTHAALVKEWERLRHEVRDCEAAIRFIRKNYRVFYPTISCFGRGRSYLKIHAKDIIQLKKEADTYRKKSAALQVYMQNQRYLEQP